MSFSSNVKAELCKDSMGRKSCAVAESYGVLLYCNTFTSAEIRIITESRDFAARLPKLFKRAFGVRTQKVPAILYEWQGLSTFHWRMVESRLTSCGQAP